MTTLNIKEGDWLLTDNGLASKTLVYLKTDESNDLGAGWFSAWFYNAKFGLDCADWATFHIKDYPNTSKLSQFEIDCLPPKLVEVAKPDYFKKQFERLAKMIEETA